MQGFDTAALDRWLTTDPRDQDQEYFERFCDEADIPYDAPGAWEQYEAYESERLEEYQEGLAEEQAERMRMGDSWYE